MKKKVIFFLILTFKLALMHGQNITIKGRQFINNGNNFYPIVMNYYMENSYNTLTHEYFFTPCHSYGISNDFENLDQISSDIQIQNDFNHIATMGFNCIRIAGFYPKYDPVLGLVFNYINHDFTGNSINQLNPTNPNDPGMLKLLSMYEHILTLANNTINLSNAQPSPLKVIFNLIGNASNFDTPEIAAWNDFFYALSSKIPTCTDANALFAYDLMNEPCGIIKIEKSKIDACQMFSGWYDIIKTNDPNHLITLGSCGTSDVFSADPSLLKLDFISLHYYPDWRDEFEDRTINSIQTRMQNRTLNELYWINKNSPMPWIVGETGYTANLIDANNSDWQMKKLDGTINDQSNYAGFALNASCNCGSSGFSWWEYQDLHFNDWDPSLPNSKNYAANFYGLLYGDTYPSISSNKPAVMNFLNFVPNVSLPCPVDRSSHFSSNKIYYNILCTLLIQLNNYREM